jgi:ribosome-associated protein
MEQFERGTVFYIMDTKNTETMRVVTMDREPVELYKILKFESLVSTGGEAKQVIVDGLVRVNGEVETHKRKKMYSGDMIAFDGKKLKVVIP